MWPYTQLQVEYFCQHLSSRILFSQRLCHQKLSFLKMIIPVSCQTVSRSESQALAAVVQLRSWKGFLTFYSPVRKASSAKRSGEWVAPCWGSLQRTSQDQQRQQLNTTHVNIIFIINWNIVLLAGFRQCIPCCPCLHVVWGRKSPWLVIWGIIQCF